MTSKEFEHIAQRLRPSLKRVGYAYFGSEADAEDVAQEALIRLWKYAEPMDASQELGPLANRIAKWCCIDFERRHSSPAPAGPIMVDIEDSGSTPYEQMVGRDAEQMLEQAVGELNLRERQMFTLRYFDGLSTDEVALRTSVPKASVQSMVSRARKKVYEKLLILINT